MIRRYIVAFFRGLKAIFSQYDPIVKQKEGFPFLKGWEEKDFFYSSLYDGVKFSELILDPQEIESALVFNEIQGPTNIFYLKKGTYKIGPHFKSDILLTQGDLINEMIQLKVEKGKALLESKNDDYLPLVNGRPSQKIELYDHDECEFAGARFYYLELNL